MPDAPKHLPRRPRPLPRPRGSRLLYLLAGVCAVAAAVIAALWLSSAMMQRTYVILSANLTARGPAATTEPVTGHPGTAPVSRASPQLRPGVIALTVTDYAFRPVPDLDVSTAMAGEPGPDDPAKFHWVGRIDSMGQLQFQWPHAAGLLVRISQEDIPLYEAAVQPIAEVNQVELALPGSWPLGGETLDRAAYVKAQHKRIADLQQAQRARQALTDEVVSLLSAGRVDEAASQLAADNDASLEPLRQQVAAAQTAVKARQLAADAGAAAARRDYDKAAALAEQAESIATLEFRRHVEAQLSDIYRLRRQQQEVLAGANLLITGQMPAFTGEAVASHVDEIAAAAELIRLNAGPDGLVALAEALNHQLDKLDAARGPEPQNPLGSMAVARERLHSELVAVVAELAALTQPTTQPADQ